MTAELEEIERERKHMQIAQGGERKDLLPGITTTKSERIGVINQTQINHQREKAERQGVRESGLNFFHQVDPDLILSSPHSFNFYQDGGVQSDLHTYQLSSSLIVCQDSSLSYRLTKPGIKHYSLMQSQSVAGKSSYSS